MRIKQRPYGILDWLFGRAVPKAFILACDDCGYSERIAVGSNLEAAPVQKGNAGFRIVGSLPKSCHKCGGGNLRKMEIQLRLWQGRKL